MLCAAVAYARGAHSQRPRERATSGSPYVFDRRARRGRVAATDAAAARRRLAFVSSAERGGMGAGAFDLDDRDALLVVSAGLGTLRERALRDGRSLRAAVERLRRAGAARVSRLRVVARARRRRRCSPTRSPPRRSPRIRSRSRAARCRTTSGSPRSGSNLSGSCAHRRQRARRYERSPLPHCSSRRDGCSPLVALLAYRARRPLVCRRGAVRCLAAARRDLVGGARSSRPQSTMYASEFGSTILAHGMPGIALLVRVALVGFAVCAARDSRGACRRRDRAARSAPRLGGVRAAAAASWCCPSVTRPPSRSSRPAPRCDSPRPRSRRARCFSRARRDASSRSRRYCCSRRRSSVSGRSLATFWNDAPTRTVLAVAPLAVAVVWLALRYRARWVMVLGFAAAAVAADVVAGLHAVDFVTDAFRVDNRSSGLYAWLAARRPAAIGGVGLAIGTVNLLAPATRTVELPEADACAAARRRRVALAAVAENDRSAEFNAARLRAARACGPRAIRRRNRRRRAALLGVGWYAGRGPLEEVVPRIRRRNGSKRARLLLEIEAVG